MKCSNLFYRSFISKRVNRFNFSILCSLVVFLVSCTPSVQYVDPLQDIGSTGQDTGRPTMKNNDLSNLKLGIIFSENTLKSVKHIGDVQSLASMNFLFNAKEADARNLTRELNSILQNRFKHVAVYKHRSSIPVNEIDLLMLLDIQVHMGWMSFAKTSVKITGIFSTTDNIVVDNIVAEGKATVPYPAYTYNFSKASARSMKLFAEELDHSSKLAHFTREKEFTSVELTTVPVIPESSTDRQQVSMRKPPGFRTNYTNWAVVIGISKYLNSGQENLTNLVFADDDAKDFVQMLRKLGWEDDHIKLLVNEEATQRNIMIALESWLTKAGPNDQIVLFWAGHGYPDPENQEKVYFACYDTDLRIPATGYRMDKVRRALEEIKSKHVVLLADTCHAGKLITRGPRSISIIPQINKMKSDRDLPNGWIFMVGADTDRQAIEHTSWTNGAFTHSLIKGLNGGADGFQSAGRADGIVTLGELKEYMNVTMPDETQRVLGVAKRPVITTSTGDPDIWNLTLQVTN